MNGPMPTIGIPDWTNNKIPTVHRGWLFRSHCKMVQLGSEYRTSWVFEWSKRGWMLNGLVFKCHLNTEKWTPSCFLM